MEHETDTGGLTDVTTLPVDVLLSSDNCVLMAVMRRVVAELDAGSEVLTAFDNFAAMATLPTSDG